MSTLSAAELARRTRATAHVRIDPTTAAYFLGFWLEHNIVEEVLPNRYRLTEHGRRVAGGLLECEAEEVAA